MDLGFHEHATELAIVYGSHIEWQPGSLRAVNLDFHHQLPVQVVLAADCPIGNNVVEVGLVLGHTPYTLTSLDRDLGTHR